MLYTGSTAPGFNTVTPTHVNIASISYTSIPKPNLIVEVRGGYNRFINQFLPQDLGLNPNTAFGMNTLTPGYTRYDLGLPAIGVYHSMVGGALSGAFSPIGATSSDSRGRIDTNYQLFGNVSLTKGRHSYKAGYEWRRTFINSFIDSGHRGKLVFDSIEDFLAGSVNPNSSNSATGAGTRYSYQNDSGAYFLDSWHMSSKITINYGLRWDYFGVIGAKNNAFSLFNVKTVGLETVGAAGGPSSLYPKDLHDFAPRFSVADDLLGNGKLVVRSGVGIFYDGASQDFFVGNQAYNTYGADAGPVFNSIGIAWPTANGVDAAGNPVMTMSSGVPIFSGYQPNSIFTVDQKLVTPRYVSYNLNIESQVSKKVALQLGYVGSQGRHLFHFRDLDQYNMVNGSVDQCGNGQTVTYGNSCFPNYLSGPYAGDSLWYVNQIETSAISNYNSLQTTLKMLNLYGLTSTLNYTWAHSIDTASDGLDFVPNAAMPDDSFNPHAERASSNFDVRNRVQWFWTYNFHNFDHAKKILNGWALDGMYNYATGQPYTVSFIGEANYNGSDEYVGRPDIIGDPHKGVVGRANLLNLAAFAAPCTIDLDPKSPTYNQCMGHPGSEGRNAFKSPTFTNYDFSLTKTTHLTEKIAMEFRADFFNIFNHPNLSNPLMPGFGADIFTSSHISADGSRIMPGADPSTSGTQYLSTTATPDVGTGNPYLGGGGPRSMQLAAHFTF